MLNWTLTQASILGTEVDVAGEAQASQGITLLKRNPERTFYCLGWPCTPATG